MPKIAIALQQDFADWEPALLMAAARYYLNCEVLTASPDGESVTSMGGLKISPDLSYYALTPNDFDALVIPGGYAWEKGQAFDFTPMLRAFVRENKVVAGICAAASALAESGILDGVDHTGNSLASHQRQPGYHGSALYRDQPQAIRAGKIVTAAGFAPDTFAIEVLQALELYGPEAEAELSGFAAEHRGRA